MLPVRIAEWVQPQWILRGSKFSVNSTFNGMRVFLNNSGFIPNCPYLLSPQHLTLFSLVTAIVWCWPHDMSVINDSSGMAKLLKQ